MVYDDPFLDYDPNEPCKKCGARDHSLAWKEANEDRDKDLVVRMWIDHIEVVCKLCGYCWLRKPKDS